MLRVGDQVKLTSIKEIEDMSEQYHPLGRYSPRQIGSEGVVIGVDDNGIALVDFDCCKIFVGETMVEKIV